MMRILSHSGFDVHVENKASYECIESTRLDEDQKWLHALPPNTAVKVLYPSIIYLSPGPHTIIWMTRNSTDCAKSQNKYAGSPRWVVGVRRKDITKVNKKVPHLLRMMGMNVFEAQFEHLIKRDSRLHAGLEKFLGRTILLDSIANRTTGFSRLAPGTLEIAGAGVYDGPGVSNAH